MKKSIISLFLFLFAGYAPAQVAHWIIPPFYDSIYFAKGADLIITDSFHEKIVWTPEGKRLFKTANTLHGFTEGLAVLTEPNTDRIKGFYSIRGEFTSLDDCFVAHDYPFFSDGYLVVKKGNSYYFVNTKGEVNKNGVVLAYPFRNGFSSCKDYKNRDKPKDTYNFLLKTDKNKAVFSFNGKPIPVDDLEFISSVNDEGIGIVVAKHKVYSFVNGNNELHPVFISPDEHDLKNQAKLTGKVSECMTTISDSNSILYANCGKTNQISIQFDQRMVPISIRYNVDIHTFEQFQQIRPMQSSNIELHKNNELFGISVNGVEVLPEQFEAVYDCFNNMAFVKLLGKQGLICITVDEFFKLSINKDKDIAFRHQTYETKIRLDMPSYIPSERTEIEVADSEVGCRIDPLSKDSKNTTNGNYIEYNAMLSIPPNLPDEIVPISYPIRVVSDGILFPIIQMTANAWHYKYLTVDIINSETTISKGIVSFTFDINAQRFSDEDYYPTTINIITDSALFFNSDKISETRYKCQVFDLKEGANDIIIEIVEQGCPPISSPWRINYTKPSAKTKHKEAVEIKKKTEEDYEAEEEFHFDY